MSEHVLGLLVRGLGIAMDAVDRVTSLLDAAELPVR